MNRTSGGAIIALIVVLGLAALAWWLITSGRFDGSFGPTASKAPAVQPAPSPEKPAPSAITKANEALKDLGDRLGAPAPASNDGSPSFDVARIEANGEAVIAGRAMPGAAVELIANGQVHDRTSADSSGAFVFVPKPLPPGTYDITLRATGTDGKVMESRRGVAVALEAKDRPAVAQAPRPSSPAADASKPPVVAAVPQAPVAAPVAPATKEAELRIETMQPEAGGGLFISGRAAPGSRIRLFMNDGYIATGTASAEGRVAFSIQAGVRPGDYRIRLEQMGAADSVVSRVEMPFRAPATVAAAAPTAPPAPAQAPAPAAPETIVAARPPEPTPAPAAPVATPAQPPAVASEKPVLPPAIASQPALPQLAAPQPTTKDAAQAPAAPPAAASAPSSKPAAAPPQIAAAPAAEPAPRTSSEAPASRSTTQPSAAAPQSATPAAPQTVAPAAPQPAAPSVAASQPPAQAPGSPATPKAEPKASQEASPRIAGRANDRRDAVIIPRIDTRLVIRGDNLWRISQTKYGAGQRYTLIFGANRDKIRDPDLIYPGQIFVLPRGR